MNTNETDDLTPEGLRMKFIKEASPLIKNYINAALGKEVLKSTSTAAREGVWKVLEEVLIRADAKVAVKGLSEGTISERVDAVLEQVANGELTIAQGKRLIEMLQAGFNITELPELVAKLQQ